jgi:hypothetical protein
MGRGRRGGEEGGWKGQRKVGTVRKGGADSEDREHMSENAPVEGTCTIGVRGPGPAGTHCQL